MRSLVSDLAAGGVTVLLSTHLLSEVEQICTHVGVMHVGKLVAQSRLSDLRSQTAPRVRVRDRPAGAGGRQPGPARPARDVADGTQQWADQRRGHRAARRRRPEAVIAALVHDEVPVLAASGRYRSNLEDVFVTLTGEGFGVSG